MESKYLFGVRVDNLSKDEFLSQVESKIKKKQKGIVVTPYSEFFVKAQSDHEFKKVLNSSVLSTADGAGVKLGLKYFELLGKRKDIFSKTLVLLRCMIALFVNKKFYKGIIKAKLSGSEFIYDLCKLAADKKYPVFFLGGFDFGNGNTGVLASEKLKTLYPDLIVAGTYSGSPDVSYEKEIVNLLNKVKPKMIFLAYGPVRQEKWAYRNLSNIETNLIFCLGGTFDFVAGEKKQVPKFFRQLGLEGVLRPFISERGDLKLIITRLKRGWGGIFKYIRLLIISQ